MKFVALASALAVAACTTTPAALSDKPLTLSVDSAKAPRALANCIVDQTTSADLRDEGDNHFVVTRSNNFGAIGRWDIYPAGSGSKAEWRRAGSLTTGAAAGRRCA